VKIWTEYASSHSAGFRVCAHFMDAAAATETLHLLRAISQAPLGNLPPRAFATSFAALGLSDTIADILLAQDQLARTHVYENSTDFSVSIRDAYVEQTGQHYFELLIESVSTDFQWGTSFHDIVDALNQLIQHFGGKIIVERR
jgi:hypothetical protein